MNATLLLRLAAPLQSWGTESKFENRTTQREPSKSGVIGMLAAALGRGRDESIDDLAALSFGVRIDQPGQLLKDYHTAWCLAHKKTYVTRRHYLMDAVFVVGVEGGISLLQTLQDALDAPVYPLFLGRRSCPPEGCVTLGIREMPLAQALHKEAWHAAEWYQQKHKTKQLTLVLDTGAAGFARRRDVPISFSQLHRRHDYRYIDDTPDTVPVEYARAATEHDVFAEMEA